MTRLLEPMRRGFLVVNRRVTAPLLRNGLGPLIATPVTGSMLLLRTRGRRSGVIREAPLGYAVRAGEVLVVAGYGRSAHWFANALADPRVELVLPGARFAGTAREITDPDERREAFDVTIRAMGVVGRATLGDLDAASPERIDELAAAFPVLAITPTALLDGPFDPGGVGVRWTAGVATAHSALVVGACYLARRCARRGPRSGG
ncbi:nitroreductase family deazaflavin-dependent oxidoreductase [Actinotalea sp. M2MS4P-6]|uniref:nitroreductase family deazaflavin-dependent oxidoreductase n=1 Tax=Actinotalea sp. M2MS4P-6 TaxID=2983762 RepID=UPI0021E485DF|nr:nitroreductase family deazaflavin-dependent oxidoreductase [Actinotalea sp. M2MS4P-6]